MPRKLEEPLTGLPERRPSSWLWSPTLLGGGAGYLDAEFSRGEPFCLAAEGTPSLAFTVKRGTWHVAGGKQGQAFESLQKGTSPASLCPTSMQVLLTISEHCAHTRLPYTQIYSIYELYINIYTHTHVHICRVHLQAQKPRPRTAVGDPEESWPYFRAALPGAGRKLATARERAGPGGRVGVTQLTPHSSVPCNLPLPPPKREHLVCPVSGRTPVIPELGTQRKDNLCKSEVRWSTLGLHLGEFPASWGRLRETPCQTKQEAKRRSGSPPLPKGLPD